MASLRALLRDHWRDNADVIGRPELPRFSPKACTSATASSPFRSCGPWRPERGCDRLPQRVLRANEGHRRGARDARANITAGLVGCAGSIARLIRPLLVARRGRGHAGLVLLTDIRREQLDDLGLAF